MCLKLQTKHLEPDSRQLAETNYQMGITYCLTEQYSQAIQHLNNSIVVIKSRLGTVRAPPAALWRTLCCAFGMVRLIWDDFLFKIVNWLAEKLQELLDKAEDPQALPEERKEMEELKVLLPEIQEKVDDATDAQKSATAAADAVKDALVSRYQLVRVSHILNRTGEESNNETNCFCKTTHFIS